MAAAYQYLAQIKDDETDPYDLAEEALAVLNDDGQKFPRITRLTTLSDHPDDVEGEIERILVQAA